MNIHAEEPYKNIFDSLRIHIIWIFNFKLVNINQIITIRRERHPEQTHI
jgi:hypothetical protein